MYKKELDAFYAVQNAGRNAPSAVPVAGPRMGSNDPDVSNPTDGAVLLIPSARARNYHDITNAADLVIEGGTAPPLSYNATERFPPPYVEGGVGVVSFRTRGRLRFQLGTRRSTIFGRGEGPSLTAAAHANLGLVFRITSGLNAGFTRGWRLSDLTQDDDEEPYTWSLATTMFWDALVAGHRVTGAFVDLSASGAVSLTAACRPTGSASTPPRGGACRSGSGSSMNRSTTSRAARLDRCRTGCSTS